MKKKKSFLFVLISLFAITLLFSGCNKQDVAKAPANNIKVVSDVPVQVAKTTKKAPVNVVDSSFKTETTNSSSDVEIGSLIN